MHKERERQRDRLIDSLMPYSKLAWINYAQAAICVVDHVPNGFDHGFSISLC